MLQNLLDFLKSTGLYQFFQDNNWQYVIMILIALGLLYLAIKKKFEPYLLLPIAFGMLLVNLPGSGVFIETTKIVDGEKVTTYSG